jgi:hypothetical protein
MESLIQHSVEERWNCPVVGQFKFAPLRVEGLGPRMISGKKFEKIVSEVFRWSAA